MKHNFFDMGEGVHVLFLDSKEARAMLEIVENYQASHDDYCEADAKLAQEIEFVLGSYS